MRCFNCSKNNLNKDYECVRMPQCLMEDVESREYHNSLNIVAGDKIRFEGEKRFWKVVARDERFLVCVWRKFYTICDLYDNIRGADNYGGYYDYSDLTSEEMEEILLRLNLLQPKHYSKLKISKELERAYEEECHDAIPWDGILDTLEISHRNWVLLCIEDVKRD